MQSVVNTFKDTGTQHIHLYSPTHHKVQIQKLVLKFKSQAQQQSIAWEMVEMET